MLRKNRKRLKERKIETYLGIPIMYNTIHHQNLKLNSNRFAGQPITLLTAVDHVKRGLVYYFVRFAHSTVNSPTLDMKTSSLEVICGRQICFQ